MAAGDREGTMVDFLAVNGDYVIVKIQHRIEPTSGLDAEDYQIDQMNLDWADFLGLLTAGEISALASARTKLIAEAKVRIPRLATATIT